MPTSVTLGTGNVYCLWLPVYFQPLTSPFVSHPPIPFLPQPNPVTGAIHGIGGWGLATLQDLLKDLLKSPGPRGRSCTAPGLHGKSRCYPTLAGAAPEKLVGVKGSEPGVMGQVLGQRGLGQHPFTLALGKKAEQLISVSWSSHIASRKAQC